MRFSFYPQYEHNCPHVSHCPHLGGAALGTLVLLANEQECSAALFDVGDALHRVRACSITHAASLKPIPSHHQRALAVLGHGSPLRAAPTGRDDD